MDASTTRFGCRRDVFVELDDLGYGAFWDLRASVVKSSATGRRCWRDKRMALANGRRGGPRRGPPNTPVGPDF